MVSCRPEGNAGLVGLRVRWPLSIGSDYARPIPQAGDGLDRELLCRRLRNIATPSSGEVAAAMPVFFSVRPAARIVVVLAMPTTRTLGDRLSARV